MKQYLSVNKNSLALAYFFLVSSESRKISNIKAENNNHNIKNKNNSYEH
ncbi:Uncharacterised protein [Porphyromonas cangingivalis]|nr:Uncharacterised protein [Porphyromonas cangingivalis]